MSAFERLLRPLKVRIAGMVTRGLLKLVTESNQFELLQVRIYGGDDESPQDNVEHFQPFGFSSKAAPGAIPLLLTVGGSRAHTVAVCVADPRYRPTDLEEGESVIYSKWGDEVRLKEGRIVSIKAAAAIEVEAPEIRSSGLWRHDGKLIVSEDVIAGDPDSAEGAVSLVNHPHQNGALPGGESTPPVPTEFPA